MAPRPIFPGEELRAAAGYPAVARFEKGAPGRPLVVFVTGGGVLARIAYGHPDGQAEDFLAHWLVRAGYAFLGLSYPIGHGVFGEAHPAFTVRDWAAQTAEIVHVVVAEQALPPKVLVLAWSMAGRIVERLNAALRDRDLTLELFVAMAATPPLPNLLPALDRLTPDPRGLADGSASFFPWLLRCLHGQNELAGRSVIAEDAFLGLYTGNFPINLAATALRYRDGRFVPDPLADDADTGGRNMVGLPPIAVITHDSALDAGHALTDHANWSLHLVQALVAGRLSEPPAAFTALPQERWANIVELVRSAPDMLTVTVPGNHLFFVGAAGAGATVKALRLLHDRSLELSSALHRLGGG